MKNRLRVERAEIRMSQAELAQRGGVSRQTINAIERGDYNPSVVLALKIANLFGKQVDQISQLEDSD